MPPVDCRHDVRIPFHSPCERVVKSHPRELRWAARHFHRLLRHCGSATLWHWHSLSTQFHQAVEPTVGRPECRLIHAYYVRMRVLWNIITRSAYAFMHTHKHMCNEAARQRHWPGFWAVASVLCRKRVAPKKKMKKKRTTACVCVCDCVYIHTCLRACNLSARAISGEEDRWHSRWRAKTCGFMIALRAPAAALAIKR